MGLDRKQETQFINLRPSSRHFTPQINYSNNISVYSVYTFFCLNLLFCQNSMNPWSYKSRLLSSFTRKFCNKERSTLEVIFKVFRKLVSKIILLFIFHLASWWIFSIISRTTILIWLQLVAGSWAFNWPPFSFPCVFSEWGCEDSGWARRCCERSEPAWVHPAVHGGAGEPRLCGPFPLGLGCQPEPRNGGRIHAPRRRTSTGTR